MSEVSFFPLEPPLHPHGSYAERRDRGGLRRMRDMRFAELAYRGWQEVSKWLDRVAPVELPDRPDALLARHAPALADPDAAMLVIRDRAPHRFFAGVEHAGTGTLVTARFPEHRAAVLAEADALLTRRFDLLGSRTLWFGDPVDWHLDPLRGRRAPLVPWSLIDAGDIGQVGDSRLVWELNRHQWLVRLAQAWAVSHDERYAAACIQAVDAWLDANPPGLGINWTSSAEAAFRLISWSWVLLLIRDAPVLSPDWIQRVLAAVWLHATHIRRYLSYHRSGNAELTGEALGLFYAAVLFPEFRDADRWRDVASRILVGECDAQICGDGVHLERSTCYHRYALEDYLHFQLLADRNGVPVPDHLRARTGQMVEFLLAIRQPDGTVPAIGDDDGGSLMPLAARSPTDARALFAVAAILYQRREFAWAADGLAPDVVWLLGPDGAHAFDGLPPAPPASSASCVFPSGGYASMRSGWEPDAHHAIVDIGPIGCPLSGGHGHADLLSLQCSIFGEPCLVDAGTFASAADPLWRDYFRSTAAHSTVVVDGLSQAQPAGPFGWHAQPRVRLREWHSTSEFDFLDAEHDGYCGLPDPVVHRRRVIFVKPGYWILVDDLTGTARHDVELTFQFRSPGVTLGVHPWARAQTAKGPVLWVCPFPSAPIQATLRCGELAPIRGWVSERYGERRAAPMLIYSFAVALPWRIVTLLLPDRQGLAFPPAARAIYDDAGRPTGIAFERPRRLVRFDDQAVSVERE